MIDDMNIEIDEKRQFRSRLNSLPLEFKCEIGEIPLQKGLRATSRKERAIELLKKYNIDYIEIGTGTNRFIVKYDGYALKIALDREGVGDNIQEFAICESLMPNVAYAYEISSGGHLLVAAYCPAFTSQSEMWAHNTEIRNILGEWSKRYLLGDVGMTERTFANWGLAPGGKPVCIDYAYIFPSSLDQFECICGNKTMTFARADFSTYKCTKCGKLYEDRELRARVSSEERIRLFNGTKGIRMHNEYEMHDVDPMYIKIEYNPDKPNPYDVATEATDHIYGRPTESWL
jgi:hypothetical protein